MTSVPVAIEAVADVLASVLDRFAVPLQWVAESVERIVELIATGLLAVPQPVLVAAVGLAVWWGQRLARAALVVLALHVIAMVGIWPAFLQTISLALIAGALGVTSALGVHRLRRRWRKPIARPPAWQPAVAAVAIVTVVALQPLVDAPTGGTWAGRALGAGVVAAVLVMTTRREVAAGPGEGHDALPGWLHQLLLSGVAAALLLDVVSGNALGGVALRAAQTADLAITIQVTVALAALAVALGAVTSRMRGDRVFDPRPPEPTPAFQAAADVDV